jgi:formyltetrahydrofolate synthetase
MESSKPKNKSHVINLGEDEASQGAFVNLERPIGWKAKKEKCKTKEKINLSVVVILNDMNEDKKKEIKLFEEVHEQNKEMFLLRQEEVRLKQEELRLQARTIQLKEERKEKEFMFMDTSLLDEDAQEYVRRRKKAIL